MPTISMVMHDLAVLRHAAQVLGEPLYLFGDDVSDYFNHFALAPEDWWKCGVVFLGDAALDHLPDAPTSVDENGNFLIFVSERRMDS